jgi:hypothetical protein
MASECETESNEENGILADSIAASHSATHCNPCPSRRLLRELRRLLGNW